MNKLAAYIPLVEYLGNVLPDHFEICLQDCGDTHSIIAIAHGEVSGRKIGSPLTDLALKMIRDEQWKDNDYICNYQGCTTDNRQLCSSTYFIKEKGKLLGMLCINVDNSVYQKLSDMLLSLTRHATTTPVSQDSETEQPVPTLPVENFSKNSTDFITSSVSEINQSLNNGIPLERLTQAEKVAIIRELKNRGVFLMKGTIPPIAELLECSEATIYRYLSIVNKES